MRAILLAAALLGVLSVTTRAQAAFRGTNGDIAYVIEGSRPGERLIEDAFLGAEGALVSGERSLLDTAVDRGGDSFDPSWSADGRRLAFTSTRAGRRQVYSIELGSALGLRLLCPAEACPIVGDGAEDYEPAWSPGGTSVAFVSTRAGNPQIYVAAPATGVVGRLTFDGSVDSQPSWSRRGQIAFVGDATGVPQIYVIDSRGGPARELATGGPSVDPEWSPDGTELAYAGQTATGFQVFAFEPSTGKVRQLTSAGLESRHPSWSPDGTKLLIARGPDRLRRVRLEVIDARSGIVIAQEHVSGASGESDWGPLPSVASGEASRVSRDKAIARPLEGVVTVNPGHVSTTSTQSQQGAVSPSTTPAATLTKAVEVPVNSTYDATHGVAQLVVSSGTAVAAPTAVVSGGRFLLARRSVNSTPTIRLLGRPRGCGRARASSSRRHGGLPHVRAHTKGRWRTAGNYGAASSEGTRWEVVNTCKGTLYVALEHSLTVMDPRRRRRVRVTAGHRYLVRARRR